MNVVLVLIDSLRKDHVRVYGNDWIKTPNLDALGKESLRFTRAYPEAIPSIPARRGIHTGIRSFPFRGWELTNVTEEDVALWGWEPIPEEQTTLAEILGERGYYNLFVTDTLHQFRASYNFHRGFHVYEWIRGQERDLFRPQTPASKKKIEGALLQGPNAAHAEEIMLQYYANTMGRQREEDWFSPRVFGKGMQLLEAAKAGTDETGQPFFLLVDSFDPHEPWDPPEKYAGLYGEPTGTGEPIVPNYDTSDYLEEAELRRMRALYAGEVTLTDKWFGSFVNKMEELGFMENTLLVAFSDHGVALGEHGYTGKVARAIWPELKDIVFYDRHPEGKGAGETSDFRAGFQDIAPTVLGQMGMEPPQPMDGQDLTPVLEGKEPEVARPYVTLGYDNYSWAEDVDWALSVRNDGEEARLHDLAEDPEMNRNVASANRDIVKRMWNDYVLKDAGGEPPPMY